MMSSDLKPFIQLYDRLMKAGWLTKVVIGDFGEGTSFYCAIYADRMGISPYRFAKGDSPGAAFTSAFNSIVAIEAHMGKRPCTDDFI